MPLIVSDFTQLDIMNDLKTGLLLNATIHLFKNNFVPVEAQVLADFVEADFDGYAAQTLAAWGTVALNVDGDAQMVHTPIVWTHDGGATGCDVYGYYVVDAAGLVLLWAERNAAGPVLMDTLNQVYSVVPKLILGDMP